MNKQIYFLIRRAFYSLQNENDEVNSAWKNVQSRCKGYSKPSLKFRIFKYVAVFMLALSLGSYLWYFQQSDTSDTDHTDIRSVPPKAKLILATGEHFYLENMEQNISIKDLGVKISKDSVSNALYYNIDSLGEENLPTEYNQLIIPKGGEFSLKLADGSTVWLNSESTLKFPVQFTSAYREVYLEGEAFFDIKKNEHSPFIVHTGDKKVTVLGTRFNVSAYPEDPSWQVTLVQGKVAIQIADHEEKILQPSEQYSLNNNTGEIEIKTVETELYTSWLDGKFYFKGYRFEDIVRKLERWYDFQMHYQQEEIRNMHFRGVINKHYPLEKTLKYLEETTNITFDIDGRTITVKKTEKQKE